ncbi:hypothetical protein FACS189429_5250 [Bacteroidia bacterium]|nr:hypothetical protein FACS189429_5250 [Bacteroidia bacterium]
MDNWKEKMSDFENKFGYHNETSWASFIKYVQELMTEYSNEVEVNVRVIYALHNILVEEETLDCEQIQISSLLKQYFQESYDKFQENAEYLFFIGKILYVAEWYFGIDDDTKSIKDRIAFHMQKKTIEKEPDNILYQWAYFLSLNEREKTFLLSKEILCGNNQNYLIWLKNKGFAGNYIIDSLEYCYNNFAVVNF